MHDLFGFGQAIRSEVPVAGAIPGAASGDASITIRMLQSEAARDEPLYRRDGEDLIFYAPDAGSYRCNAQEIAIAPNEDADAEFVKALLIATALPACLWMQGAFVLHAACVIPNGAEKAIAIAGASGAGKSTLAARMLDRGAKLVGDDSIAICQEQAVCGLPGGIFLPTPTGGERTFRPADAAQISLGAGLGAIIMLDDSHNGSMQKLDSIAAVQSLLAHRHRPRIPAILGLQQRSLEMAAAIARNVPVLLRSPSRDSEGLTDTEMEAVRKILEFGGSSDG